MSGKRQFKIEGRIVFPNYEGPFVLLAGSDAKPGDEPDIAEVLVRSFGYKIYDDSPSEAGVPAKPPPYMVLEGKRVRIKGTFEILED